MSNQNPYPSPYDPPQPPSQAANQPADEAQGQWTPQSQGGDAQPSVPPLSYQEWGYQGSPYEDTYAASSSANVASQSVPSPEDLSGENTAPKTHTGWWILLTLVGLLAGTVFYFFGEMFEYGSELLVWTLIKCTVALVFALAMIPLYAAARRNALTASAQGDEKLVQTRQRGKVMASLLGLGLCLYALSNGVPAILDVVDGPHTVTVTSCSFEQYKTSRSRYRGGSRTVYENQFIMTFDDGTTHTKTVETDRKDEIATQGDLTAVLYEACALRSGSATMTIGYYTHSRVVASARINN
ncbi:hypothetical protein [Actinomyces sp. ICM54]|uniref:hypothetical protein n=1 Tax=Actinomyces sp. ICM54 TaxID=936549 RepID=UPI000551A030|nr:hypothetical protein [Actinomyces sp. ICM54]